MRGSLRPGCARMISTRPRPAASVGTALGQILSQEAPGLPQLPVKVLGKLLTQPGALDQHHVAFATECALRKVNDMDGKDCVRVLNAVVQQPGYVQAEDERLRALGDRVGEKLADISTADMVNLLKTLADNAVPAVPIFARLSAAIALRAGAASASQLTTVAVAFSEVRLADRHLFPRLAQSAVKQIHAFSSMELPTFLAAFATVGLCHEVLLTAASKALVARAPKFAALDLALVAFAYAQFFLVFPSIVSMLQKRLPSCAEELPPVRLAELSVSCARLMVREPSLVATMARCIDMRGLSSPLFGLASRSVALLGAASTPHVQEQIASECFVHLEQMAEGGDSWILDIMDCFGEIAEDVRLNHGGAFPVSLPRALQQACVPLQAMCLSLNPQEVSGLYRSLRQLPPSLVISSAETGLWPLHQALGSRVTGLAKADAFSYVELASTIYSHACLYPQVWFAGTEDAPLNPRWHMLKESAACLQEAWCAASPPGMFDDARSLQQAAVLAMLMPDAPAISLPKETPRFSRSRPVAMELLEILRTAGEQPKGPFFEGCLEVHAAAGERAFCLLAEDAYFRRHDQVGAFAEVDGDAAVSGVEKFGFELCLEEAFNLRLLQHHGWLVVPVPFHTWRRLSPEQKRRFVAASADHR